MRLSACLILLSSSSVWPVDRCHAWSLSPFLTSSSSSTKQLTAPTTRRGLLEQAATATFLVGGSNVGSLLIAQPARAEEAIAAAAVEEDLVQTIPYGEMKKIFNEGRALESQGNMAAAQRLYAKVTKMAPRFVYGWSNLGNTQTAFGDLGPADSSYTKAIDLCKELDAKNAADSATAAAAWTNAKCNDLYILYLNRGSLRLNTGQTAQALADLQLSATLRGRPDAILLQNLARAKELNGLYMQADRDYTTAISMTAGEVAPFWLRSVLVKYQIDDEKSAMDLMKRINQRFPEAPEVRAAYATLLYAAGDEPAGRQKFLEIPNRQRLQFVDPTYLSKTVGWPPKMKATLARLTKAVGDDALSAAAAAAAP